MVVEARHRLFPAPETNVRTAVVEPRDWTDSFRTPTPPIPARQDTYKRTRDSQRIAYLQSRRGSRLWDAVTGEHPLINLEDAQRENMARLNHERLSYVYLLPELEGIKDGEKRLITIVVSEKDGIIREIEQRNLDLPDGLSPVMLELKGVGGGLKMDWVDVNSLDHKQSRRWFMRREGTIIEPPGESTDYEFAGNVDDVKRFNMQRLQALYDVRAITALPYGEHRYMVAWVDLEIGLIEKFALDTKGEHPVGCGMAVCEVHREDRHGLIVRFVDTANLEGVPHEVLKWYNRSFFSVMDTMRDSDATQPPPTQAATPHSMRRYHVIGDDDGDRSADAAVDGGNVVYPDYVPGEAGMSPSQYGNIPTPVLGAPSGVAIFVGGSMVKPF